MKRWDDLSDHEQSWVLDNIAYDNAVEGLQRGELFMPSAELQRKWDWLEFEEKDGWQQNNEILDAVHTLAERLAEVAYYPEPHDYILHLWRSAR